MDSKFSYAPYLFVWIAVLLNMISVKPAQQVGSVLPDYTMLTEIGLVLTNNTCEVVNRNQVMTHRHTFN